MEAGPAISWGRLPAFSGSTRSDWPGQPVPSVASPPPLATWTFLFLRFLALAHLADEYRFGSVTSVGTWLVVVAAAALAVRPASGLALAAMAGTKCWLVIAAHPFVNNHDLIFLVVDGALLACLAVGASGWLGLVGSERVRRYLRTLLLLAYSAAALSKLNRGFLDPEWSCAVELALGALSPVADVSSARSAIPAAVVATMPFAVAGIELVIPMLLLVRRTRSIGVLVAIFFHLVLSISPTAIGLAFSGLLFALLVPFLTDGQIQARPSALRRFVQPGGAVAVRLPNLVGGGWWWTAVAIVVATLGLFQAHGGLLPVAEPWWVPMVVIVFSMGALISAAVVLDHRHPRSVVAVNPSTLDRHGTVLPVVFSALAAVVVLSAVAPYVGAGTTPSFTMYSNIRTEQRSSNHYLLPSVGLFGTQDDLVEVVRSSTLRIPTTAQTGLLITEHEARRLVSHHPGSWLEVVFRGSGEQRQLAVDDASILDWIAFKVVRHRPVDPVGPSCRW